jgi:hypothetical protein
MSRLVFWGGVLSVASLLLFQGCQSERNRSAIDILVADEYVGYLLVVEDPDHADAVSIANHIDFRRTPLVFTRSLGPLLEPHVINARSTSGSGIEVVPTRLEGDSRKTLSLGGVSVSSDYPFAIATFFLGSAEQMSFLNDQLGDIGDRELVARPGLLQLAPAER